MPLSSSYRPIAWALSLNGAKEDRCVQLLKDIWKKYFSMLSYFLYWICRPMISRSSKDRNLNFYLETHSTSNIVCFIRLPPETWSFITACGWPPNDPPRLGRQTFVLQDIQLLWNPLANFSAWLYSNCQLNITCKSKSAGSQPEGTDGEIHLRLSTQVARPQPLRSRARTTSPTNHFTPYS